jgi:hypothetical protein
MLNEERTLRMDEYYDEVVSRVEKTKEVNLKVLYVEAVSKLYWLTLAIEELNAKIDDIASDTSYLSQDGS